MKEKEQLFNELFEFREHYDRYSAMIREPENQEKIKFAKADMRRIKKLDKFIFTPRYLPMSMIRGHIRKCEKTIGILNRILKETREGERTPLSEVIPKRVQYNIPSTRFYEIATELVDPKFPSIMESRIDGSLQPDKTARIYEVNANRAGWENSRSFCSIYQKYFGDLTNGWTVDFADGWESTIRHVLKRINGDKVLYITEQRGREAINSLRNRGLDIDYIQYQEIRGLIKRGELEITKDDVVYKGERVDLICRYLRTHQILRMKKLCECIKHGNIHLINQMDAFFGGLKTLLIKLRDEDELSPYAKPEDIVQIPYSRFLRGKRISTLVKNKDNTVLKFGNRGGGKRIYFGEEYRKNSWEKMLRESREQYPETAMIQERTMPSLTPRLDDGKISFQNTTCDVFVFTRKKPEFGGVFSRWSYKNLVNYKTGGIKQTVFV